MKSSRKSAAAVTLAVLGCALALAGCAKPETLKVLHYVNATQAGYAEDQAIWAKFVKDNPGIKLEKEELFDEAFHNKVQAYVASGQMPDVMYMWPSGRSTTIHQNKLTKDLSPLLGKEYLGQFAPAAVDPKQQYNGYLAMLPEAITYTTVLYVNKRILAENGFDVPKTYDDLKKMVPRLKAKGIQTLFAANQETWVMESCLFSTVVGRLLGDQWIDEVLAGKAKFTDQPFVDALAFIERMYKDGVIQKDTIQVGYGEGPGVFASGKAAIMLDGDWQVGAFITDKASGKALLSPQVQKEDIVLIDFPAIPGERNPGISSAIVGTGWGISAAIEPGSAKEKAALKLFKYLNSKEVETVRYEMGAFIPALKGISSDKVEPLSNMMAAYYATIPKTCYVLDGVLDAGVCLPINDGLQQLGLGTTTPRKVAEATQKALDEWRAAKK